MVLRKLHWLFCLLIVSHAVFAEQSVSMATPSWPGYTDKDDTGVYNSLFDNAFSPLGLERTYVEFSKAKRLFLNGDVDVFVGAYRNEFPDKVYPQWHIDVESPVFAIVLADHLRNKGILNFSGKQLGWRKGFNFEKDIKASFSYYPISDLTNGLRLLDNGRLFAVLEYEHQLPVPLDEKYALQPVVSAKKIWLVFHNSEKGRSLASRFDKGVEALISAQAINEIYNGRALEAGFPASGQ